VLCEQLLHLVGTTANVANEVVTYFTDVSGMTLNSQVTVRPLAFAKK
jgi:hypothetical protein